MEIKVSREEFLDEFSGIFGSLFTIENSSETEEREQRSFFLKLLKDWKRDGIIEVNGEKSFDFSISGIIKGNFYKEFSSRFSLFKILEKFNEHTMLKHMTIRLRKYLSHIPTAYLGRR